MKGGINLYGYAGGNPVNVFDPNGLTSTTIPGYGPFFIPEVAISGSPANDAYTDAANEILNDLWDKIDPDSMPDGWSPPIDLDDTKREIRPIPPGKYTPPSQDKYEICVQMCQAIMKVLRCNEIVSKIPCKIMCLPYKNKNFGGHDSAGDIL